jgi:hypothetical protein
MHSYDWRISESNLAPTANAIFGVKSEHSRLEPIEIYEQSVTSYWPLWVGNLIADNGNPDGRNVRTGLAKRIS